MGVFEVIVKEFSYENLVNIDRHQFLSIKKAIRKEQLEEAVKDSEVEVDRYGWFLKTKMNNGKLLLASHYLKSEKGDLKLSYKVDKSLLYCYQNLFK